MMMMMTTMMVCFDADTCPINPSQGIIRRYPIVDISYLLWQLC